MKHWPKERKGKRLEAWRKLQEQQVKAAEISKPNKAQISLSLGDAGNGAGA